MKKIEKNHFKAILEKQIFDFCMLLPILESDGALSAECYVSELCDSDFLCHIKYGDGSETLDINWGQKSTREITELVSEMKAKGKINGSVAIAVYKNVELLREILRLCKREGSEYVESFYSDGEITALPDTEELSCSAESDAPYMSWKFLNQNSNHIKIIQRDTLKDAQNNKIIYLKHRESVVGYVALKRQYRNIWDVAYIFVDEEQRERGYATYLCRYAIALLKNEGCTLFYSFCENEASLAVAKKSLLKPCAQRYVFLAEF